VRKERFAVDQEKTRKYFPTAGSVRYAMLVAETLYGITLPRGNAPAWHPTCAIRHLRRRQRQVHRQHLPRSLSARRQARRRVGRRVRRASTLAGRTPTSVLVTNFNREGLSHRELETLLHEFGHVLHGVLSTAQYVSQAGTAVKRDFVEAPSQMFEEWVRREETLALFRKVCAECPVLSKEEIARLNDARRFG
jgi:thimet oligopeptidase